MPRTFFVTFPNDDITLFYLFSYEREILNFAEKRGVKVIKFEREKATRKNVESFLKSNSPGMVVLNGHGDENSVAGYKKEPLLVKGENEQLLESAIVYSISCSSASKLGLAAVEKGVRAFIGYNDEFVFLFDKSRTATPLRDELAQNFLEPSNALIISLLKGHSVEEAYAYSQNTFDKKIERLLTSEALPGAEHVIAFLVWDKSIQTFAGDGTALF